MVEFRILQIKDIEHTDYAFRGHNPEKFNIEDYEERYALKSETMDCMTDAERLEVVFNIFNMRIPEDFSGHSLSVSDLVWINNGRKIRLYYCDIVGWTLIKEVRA